VRRPRAENSTAGFTLVEALVATALMGIVMAGVATITSQWLPNWNRGIVGVQRNDLMALALDRLTADLAAAEFITANHRSFKPLFDGTNRSVTFVRTAVGPTIGSGLEIIRIAEVNSDRGPTLVRTRAPFTAMDDQVQPSFRDPVVLLRAPYQLTFSYAGSDRAWQNEWHEQVRLPRAIKLTVRDFTTQRSLSISTATTVHVEVPAKCIAVKSLPGCFKSALSAANVDNQ
jgi:general secretion pathway protein J